MSKALRLLYEELRFHQMRNRITATQLCLGCRKVKRIMAAIRHEQANPRPRLRSTLHPSRSTRKRTLL